VPCSSQSVACLLIYQVYTTQELKHSMKWGQVCLAFEAYFCICFWRVISICPLSNLCLTLTSLTHIILSLFNPEWIQAARKRSRLHGEILPDEEEEAVEEQSVASSKPYKCPVPGCLKRYLIRRLSNWIFSSVILVIILFWSFISSYHSIQYTSWTSTDASLKLERSNELFDDYPTYESWSLLLLP